MICFTQARLQGLLANGFISAFNTLLPDKAVTPLTDAEIVAFAVDSACYHGHLDGERAALCQGSF